MPPLEAELESSQIVAEQMQQAAARKSNCGHIILAYYKLRKRLVPDSPAITRVVQKDFFAVQKTCCAQLG